MTLTMDRLSSFSSSSPSSGGQRNLQNVPNTSGIVQDCFRCVLESVHARQTTITFFPSSSPPRRSRRGILYLLNSYGLYLRSPLFKWSDRTGRETNRCTFDVDVDFDGGGGGKEEFERRSRGLSVRVRDVRQNSRTPVSRYVMATLHIHSNSDININTDDGM
jgi:hypothetical protein